MLSEARYYEIQKETGLLKKDVIYAIVNRVHTYGAVSVRITNGKMNGGRGKTFNMILDGILFKSVPSPGQSIVLRSGDHVPKTDKLRRKIAKMYGVKPKLLKGCHCPSCIHCKDHEAAAAVHVTLVICELDPIGEVDFKGDCTGIDGTGICQKYEDKKEVK